MIPQRNMLVRRYYYGVRSSAFYSTNEFSKRSETSNAHYLHDMAVGGRYCTMRKPRGAILEYKYRETRNLLEYEIKKNSLWTHRCVDGKLSPLKISNFFNRTFLKLWIVTYNVLIRMVNTMSLTLFSFRIMLLITICSFSIDAAI